MACETYRRRGQSLTQRKDEVRKVTEKFIAGLKSGSVKATVDKKTGAVAFSGVSDDERTGITDACVYRRILVSGSQLALQAIQKAERLAGRSVDRQMVATGHHSHDGGETWHKH